MNTYKVTLSGDSKTVRLSQYLPSLPTTHSVAVFVGAMARGKDDFADAVVDEKISISDYSLSASVACGKVCAYWTDINAELTNFSLVLLRDGRDVGHRVNLLSFIACLPSISVLVRSQQVVPLILCRKCISTCILHRDR